MVGQVVSLKKIGMEGASAEEYPRSDRLVGGDRNPLSFLGYRRRRVLASRWFALHAAVLVSTYGRCYQSKPLRADILDWRRIVWVEVW